MACRSTARTFMAGSEKLVALPAVFLGLVHRGVGVLDQRLRIGPVVGVHAHADAGGDVEIVRRWSEAPPPPSAAAVRQTRRRPIVPTSESSTTNSSPPCRLTVSELRTQLHSRCCNRLEQLIADGDGPGSR